MTSLIAREGYPIIGAVACIALVLLVCSYLAGTQLGTVLRILALISFLFALFSIYFFRDPERAGDYSPNVLIAPADGTIIDIRETPEPLYLNGTAKRVSIFMSVFNVHVNRAPVNGTIEFLKYNQGKFISAFKDKASDENESMFAGIQCTDRPDKIAVKFIAGLIARRIVFYKKLSDQIRQGERINMIRFGSRVDVYCPVTAAVKVKNGDTVTAGVTVIATLQGE